MALNLTYPTNSELMEVAQDKIDALRQNRPIFDIMPTRNLNSPLLMWEQKDNFTGLQQVRGMNGDPLRVKRVGAKRYIMEPGIYGEHLRVDEQEITMRRPLGVYQGAIDVSDIVMELQDQLLTRRMDRIEWIGWQLLINGSFSVAHENGAVLHNGSYSPQTFTATVPWGTQATSTPLADFRAIQLLSRGHSVSFGPSARAYMNQKTFNKLLANTNSADLYGRRTQGLATINNEKEVMTLWSNDGLPGIVVYDFGYQDDTNTFVPWIPDDKVVVIGQRPGNQPVAEYLMTINANNENQAPGAYQRIIDKKESLPRSIEVHDGHNGGPAIYFPSAVVVMSV